MAKRGNSRGRRRSASFWPGVAAVVLTAVAFAFIRGRTDWPAYGVWLAACGLSTLALFGWDKLKAELHGWRIPEAVLLTMIMVGGVAGGWLGMLGFWHKVRDQGFWVVLIAASLLHGAALLFLPM
ncbi:MAG: DUF1294 domain-containing protein [Chloroflexi bacterium]|nr:DUF1294 domain-containing protein [Chloroflexota bacterium]